LELWKTFIMFVLTKRIINLKTNKMSWIEDNSFITKLDGINVDVYDKKSMFAYANKELSDDDNCDIDCVAQVSWEFYTEMRSWGVKDVGVYGTHVSMEIEVTMWLDGELDDDDEIEETFTIEIDTNEVGREDEWEIVTDTTNCDKEQYCPTDVSIDFGSKTITINF